MKINGVKKGMSRWTALLAVLLCMAMCVSLAGCGAASAAQRNEPAPISDQMEPDKSNESGKTDEPVKAERPEDAGDVDYRIRITELGGDAFHVEGDFEVDLTIQLPASWTGKYTYEIDKSGVAFYDKTARADAPEGSTWGELFAVRCIQGQYPINYPWGYYARVLAVTGAYTVMMEYPDDIQSAELVKSDEETTQAYMAMRRDAEQVTVALGDGLIRRARFTEDTWVDGTVTIYQNYISGDDGSLFRIAVFCDAETSAAIRKILDERDYASDGVPLYKYHGTGQLTIVTDEAVYDIPDLEKGDILKDWHSEMAVQPLTAAETEVISCAINSDGKTWQVKGTEPDDAFRTEDDPEADLTGEELIEAMEATKAHFEREAATGELYGEKMAFLMFVVSPDVDATVLNRQNGTIGDSDWAFLVRTIFVPEDPDVINKLMAGNTHEYTGADPTVPDGAWEMTHVGVAAREVNAWHVEIVGTGW